MKSLINNYEETPFTVINYLGSVINYGGRVTDRMDKRLIRYILKGFMHTGALEEGYKYSKSGIYKVLPMSSHGEYYSYFDSLPL